MTFPPACMQREGQLEGHLSGSVFDEAPNIDKHWYTCLAASRLAVLQRLTTFISKWKVKALNDETWNSGDLLLNQLKIGLCKICRKKNESRGVHALGFALDEKRRKRSPEFFLSREWAHQSRCWGGGGVRVCREGEGDGVRDGGRRGSQGRGAYLTSLLATSA